MTGNDANPTKRPLMTLVEFFGIAFMAVAAAVVGIALGGGIIAFVSLATQEAKTKEYIEAYIVENPQFILDTLQNHARDTAAEARRQDIIRTQANDGAAVLGNATGDVTIYEFSDYNCGYCKRVFADLMAVVAADGNIRVVIKELPILSQGSVVAARHALAAAELGQFEAFHTALMGWQGRVDAGVVEQIISDLNIDRTALAEALADPNIEATLAENQMLAGRLGIRGTPGFIIGDEIIIGGISQTDIQNHIATARGESSG